MMRTTEEQFNAFNEDIHSFFDEVNKQKNSIQEDLKAVQLPLVNGKICDFGCGLGYTTYCLASILNATKSIGVDNDSATIHKANLWFKALELYKQISIDEETTDGILTQEVNHMVSTLHPPEFLVRDVVAGENLPSHISLAYCRKLLVNIFVGGYENNMSGLDGCQLAIQNIVKTLTPRGWFVAIEERQGGDFSQLFEKCGLNIVDKTSIQLNGALPCYRYVYRKQ